MAILARSSDFLLCDHTKTFTLDVHIPNITLYISVVVRITYGSKKWAELVEVDWIGGPKRQITGIKKLTDEGNWNCWYWNCLYLLHQIISLSWIIVSRPLLSKLSSSRLALLRSALTRPISSLKKYNNYQNLH